jgi:hypothetical protein
VAWKRVPTRRKPCPCRWHAAPFAGGRRGAASPKHKPLSYTNWCAGDFIHRVNNRSSETGWDHSKSWRSHHRNGLLV